MVQVFLPGPVTLQYDLAGSVRPVRGKLDTLRLVNQVPIHEHHAFA
jgi:hypothetical protein